VRLRITTIKLQETDTSSSQQIYKGPKIPVHDSDIKR
jgi:hypothetical protein